MNARALKLKPIALALVNLGLAALAYRLYITGEHRIHEPDELAIPTLAAPDTAFLGTSSAPAQDFSAIRENAVFHSERSFYRPPPPPVVQSLPRPDYQLSGLLSLPSGKRVAFLSKAGDHTTRPLHVGDDLEGWRVEQIGADGVSLVHDTERFQIANPPHDSPRGLIYVKSTPLITRVRPHILGGQGSTGASTTGASPTSATVAGIVGRTYRPPPH